MFLSKHPIIPFLLGCILAFRQKAGKIEGQWHDYWALHTSVYYTIRTFPTVIPEVEVMDTDITVLCNGFLPLTLIRDISLDQHEEITCFKKKNRQVVIMAVETQPLKYP